MISPAQRAQRRAAGKRSGQVRAGHEDGPSPDADPSAPMPTTSDPDVDAQLEAYDRSVGQPQSWPDVKNREQVRGEILRNKAVARQGLIDSGHILTRDQVRLRDESHASAFKEGLSTVNELLAKHVPADKLLAAQKEARNWIDGILERVANAIEGAK